MGDKNPMYGKFHSDITKAMLSENSHKRDRTIREFHHNDGRIFIGEMSVFYKKFNLCRSWTTRVITGDKNLSNLGNI
jgi:hypothetical protein